MCSIHMTNDLWHTLHQIVSARRRATSSQRLQAQLGSILVWSNLHLRMPYWLKNAALNCNSGSDRLGRPFVKWESLLGNFCAWQQPFAHKAPGSNLAATQAVLSPPAIKNALVKWQRVHGNAPTCLEPLSGLACPARRVSSTGPPPQDSRTEPNQSINWWIFLRLKHP